MLRAYDENAMASTPAQASKNKRAPLSNRPPPSSKQPLQKQHLVASELKPRRALGDISNATPLAAPHSQLHHAQHKAVPKPKHGVELFPDDVPPVERFHRVSLAPPPSLDASGIDLDACVAAACGAQGAAAAYASEEPYDQVTIESLLAESLLDEVPLPPHLHPGLVAPDEVQPSGSSPPASLAEPYHLDMGQFKAEVSNDESEEDTDMELE